MNEPVLAEPVSVDLDRTRAGVRRPPLRLKRSGVKLIVLYSVSFLLLTWALAPILWVFISSISNRIELYSVPYKHWLPQHPTFDNYKALFTSGVSYRGGSSSGSNIPSTSLLISGLKNSLITSLGTAIAVTAMSTLAGYAFARLRFRGRSFFFLLMAFLLPLPIWVSLIRLYFVVSNMGLLDQNGGLILVFIAYSIPLYVWIMETYVRATPPEIEEAALIDGCTRISALWRVIVPVALPGLAAVFMTSLLTTWNAFLIPLIFSNSQNSLTLPVVLSLFIGQYEVAWESMAAAAMLTLLPPLLIALFFQRYLTRGLSLGAVR